MPEPLRIGTLGAARITPGALTGPAADNDDVVVSAVAARDPARAAEFAEKHGIETVHATYDDLISDDSLDAIYNPLPISHHHEYTIKALRTGKHVLCEKAFSLNAREAEEMAAVGHETGLVLMEAFHSRYHPMFARAMEIYDSGDLGNIQHIEARFLVGTPKPKDIRMHFETGGGATMDMGCYPISWLRHLTRQEPTIVSAEAQIGNPNVDLRLEVHYELAGGITATTIGSMCDPGFTADLTVTGDAGRLLAVNPLSPQSGNKIEVTINGETTREEASKRPSYAYQLDAFVDAIRNGTPMPTDADDAVKQMRIVDAAYLAAGMKIR